MTSPEEPASVRPVDYKGEPLDAERGPGLGCFRFQLGLLVVLIILTPLSVAWNWPVWTSVAFLFVTLILLLFAGQTVIFLLRLVGELEDEAAPDPAPETDRTTTADPAAESDQPGGAGVRE